MGYLTPDEKALFAAAASALIAAKETMEAVREDILAAGEARVMKMTPAQEERWWGAGSRMVDVYMDVKRKHPGLTGISFRGKLFHLRVDIDSSQAVVDMIDEEGVERIDG